MRSPWLRLPISLLFVVPAFLAQGLVWHWRPALGLVPTSLVSALVASLGGAGAYALYVRRIEKRPVVELGGRGSGAECGRGLAIGLALFAATIGVLAACGVYSVAGRHPLEVATVPLLASIGAAVIEEILFRGLLFRLVEEALGTWTALGVSSALFGAGHLMNPDASWQGVVAIAFEAGLLLAAAYLVTRRLWMAIGLHAGWNFAESGLFGVPTSGVPLQGLLVGRLDGPEWLSGGAFGAEASVVALVVCTAAGLGLLRVAHRRGRFVAPPWRRAAAADSAAQATARSPASPDPAAAPSGP